MRSVSRTSEGIIPGTAEGILFDGHALFHHVLDSRRSACVPDQNK
jgi:hypothetical protein